MFPHILVHLILTTRTQVINYIAGNFQQHVFLPEIRRKLFIVASKQTRGCCGLCTLGK